MTSRAVMLRRPGPAAPAALVVDERPVPRPAAGEVLVAVEACAVCRTDLQLCEGDLVAHRLPVVPGHQAVGRVVEVGAGVSDRSTGQRVGIAWIAGACGECDACRRGDENLCAGATFTGWDRDGGFADHVTARAEFTFELDEHASATALAPLLCGGSIGYRALRLAGTGPDAPLRLGLFGFGASATCAIQIARHWGCEVFVATRAAREQERARRMGATWAGPYGAAMPAALDAAVTFAPSGDVVVAALREVRPGGTVAINAIHLDRIPEFPYQLLWGERVLRSVANVTRADVAALLALAVEIPIVTEFETHPLPSAADALVRLRDGQVRAAAVLVP